MSSDKRSAYKAGQQDLPLTLRASKNYKDSEHGFTIKLRLPLQINENFLGLGPIRADIFIIF